MVRTILEQIEINWGSYSLTINSLNEFIITKLTSSAIWASITPVGLAYRHSFKKRLIKKIILHSLSCSNLLVGCSSQLSNNSSTICNPKFSVTSSFFQVIIFIAVYSSDSKILIVWSKRTIISEIISLTIIQVYR